MSKCVCSLSYINMCVCVSSGTGLFSLLGDEDTSEYASEYASEHTRAVSLEYNKTRIHRHTQHKRRELALVEVRPTHSLTHSLTHFTFTHLTGAVGRRRILSLSLAHSLAYTLIHTLTHSLHFTSLYQSLTHVLIVLLHPSTHTGH